MNIKLPDGSIKTYEGSKTVYEITADISEGLARAAVGAVVNGKTMGMDEVVNEDAEFKVVKFEDKEGKEIFWHTSSHLMAHAIKNLFPDAKFAIGPAIETGFYYDIDLEHRFTPDDLEHIEKEMKKLVKEDLKLKRIEIKRDEAIKFFKEKNQPYKVELIEDLPKDELITIYEMGDFQDLCRGPHLHSTKDVKAFKLLSIAGAYWRGDENNKMLQRIYGISFEKKKQLDEYLERLEEAAKRDHRKIGKEMDLFSIHEEGPGFPFFHPKGMVLRNELEGWWRSVLEQNGYGEIRTPLILNEELWHKSGHWDHYKENMYFTKIDEGDFAIKPMNCPGSTIVYASDMHSYRDLPIRLAEYGQVHRHEKSGTLHGLFRVRTFTQDDAHVYCLPSQIEDEVFKMIDLADYLYSTFGFKYTVELSTRPDDFMGDIETWNVAEQKLKNALNKRGISYSINEGDGAFYGPKIDFHLEDAIGRTWQCGTIQLDFQMPVNFDLVYINEEGIKARPVMLHRALFGSVERFMGILIEHFAGKFPLWLSPVQIKVMPISNKFNDYAEEVTKKLKDSGFRVEFDDRAEKIGYKIRQAQMEKVNYMVIVGEKEAESGKISIRRRNGKEEKDLDINEFIESLKEEVKSKKVELN